MKDMITRVIRCKICCKIRCYSLQQFLTGGWNFAWLLVGYSLVTHRLLVHNSLQLFDPAFHEVPN